MTPEEHASAAAVLLRAEETRTQIGLLSLAHPDMTMDDAYAIQNEILSAKIAQGRQIAGWKIGLTSRAMQTALNIDVPDSGILFDDMEFANGIEVPAGRFIQPRIEAEIAFVMRDTISGQDVTRKDILTATECVAPALEILDTRIQRADPASGQARIITDTISDNAANAGFVLGSKRHDVDAHDLRWVPAIVFKDGDVEETGLGAGVLNDPVESVCWLARRMACYDQRIEAGQVILSGSFIRPLECPPGTRIHADYGAFGTADIAFA
ncbi:MAG: 2-oxo-hepta-3-ene-1,7-dioic acid hydratase [Boseongicola sp. SB0667_bin_21]|nr:2-oxo-hepta-3-ene-1,7-dioic acid hydratase [Boseongicola sp. SB0667_bin_21]